ncbi:MAG: carboxypeptidase-like regulatory domain-containing protein [Cyclobacteriaceae bacterium]
MKSLLSGLIILLCSWSVLAQGSVLFYGEARDSLGMPLQFANALAIDTTTQAMSGFAVTNLNGEFKLRLAQGKTYQLKITFIGYVPFERLITPTESNKIPYSFTLNSDITQLGAVEVVAEMPVTFRGDTIVYKVEAFNQGDERKLEDVLEDLPGFQIEENGEVKVQGKKVNKVLIDGKEFFDGDSKLATKNIPANVVDRVQVLQNYNDISPLQNVNESETLALNIQLKGDKKRMVFGDLTAGGGPQRRYYGHANVFYYDEKTSLNLIADANNIGELAFTMSDYFRFSGGLGSMMGNKGSNFNVSSDQLGIPMAERNTARSLDNQLAAFNMSIKPKYGWQITGFAIGSMVDNRFGSLSNRTYLQDQSTLDEVYTSSSSVNSKSGLSKLGIKYTPNPNFQIDYQIFGRLAEISNAEQDRSEVSGETNSITGSNTQSPWSIEQKLSAYYALGEKDVASVAFMHSFEHQDPIYNLGTTRRPFEDLLPLETAPTFGLSQHRMIDSESTELLASYYHIFNRKNHVNLSIGYTNNQQQFNAQLFEEIAGESRPFDSLAFRNQVDFRFEDFLVGILFKNKWKKLTWTPQLNFHHYDVSHNQLTGETGFERTMFLPGFNAKYEFTSSRSMSFKYEVNTNFMDVRSVASNFLITSYNSINQGNANLENSWMHSFNVDYRDFNMYNFFDIYGGVNYQRKMDDIRNSISVSQWERRNIPVNMAPINEELQGYLNLSKRFDNFRLTLDSRWTYSKLNNRLNELINTNTNQQQRYEGAFSTNIKKKLFIKLSHTFTGNYYEGNQGNSVFYNHESGIRLNWKITEDLSWINSYSLTSYENATANARSQFDLFDSALKYRKKGSPWEYTIQGINLLNTQSIRRDSFSENLISTYAYDIQQRYAVFKVMYDL